MGAKLDGGVGAVARSNADRVPRRLGGNAWQREHCEHCENVHRGRPEKIAECARGGASTT